jgi:hypothetical protein
MTFHELSFIDPLSNDLSGDAVVAALVGYALRALFSRTSTWSL